LYREPPHAGLRPDALRAQVPAELGFVCVEQGQLSCRSMLPNLSCGVCDRRSDFAQRDACITGCGEHYVAPNDVSDGVDGKAEIGTAVSSGARHGHGYSFTPALTSVAEALRAVTEVR